MSHSRLEPGALDQQLNRVAEQLHRDFSDEVSSAEATAEVFAEAEQFRDARITQFVPALVHRAVHDRLRRRRALHDSDVLTLGADHQPPERSLA